VSLTERQTFLGVSSVRSRVCADRPLQQFAFPSASVAGFLIEQSKGKGKAKLKFTIEQATKAQRGSRFIALLFL